VSSSVLPYVWQAPLDQGTGSVADNQCAICMYKKYITIYRPTFVEIIAPAATKHLPIDHIINIDQIYIYCYDRCNERRKTESKQEW